MSQLGAVKLQDAATANGNGVIMSLQGFDSVGIQISGTFNATIYLEATMDNVNWIEVAAYDLNSTGQTKAKALTGTGMYHIDGLGACTHFRARVNSYLSGAVTVIANAHTG